MYKSIAVLFLVVLATYILFSRQPDYFDGEITDATIHWMKDSTQNNIPQAVFSIGKNNMR